MARPGCAPGANTTFQHEPLPSATCIRLLRIQPDLVDGAIACTLQHHFPDGPSPCPGYVALSYEWGDPTPRHDILVNGRPRRVHAGLWDFLDWARRTTAGGGRSSSGRGCSSSSLWWWWWTDSLCLDQANREELSAQVARMGDIYAGARSVTIWLGRDRAVEEALGEWSARGARCDEVGIHYMKRLISNSYWGRVWITQEVAHARRATIACGPGPATAAGPIPTLDFDHLARAVRHAWTHSLYGRLDLPLLRLLALSDIRHNLKLRAPGPGPGPDASLPFWDLLRASVSFMPQAESACTRPVDAVYALVGLASVLCPGFRADRHGLAVDYAKSPEDVLWDALWEAHPHPHPPQPQQSLHPRPRDRSPSPSARGGWAPRRTYQAAFALLQHRLLLPSPPSPSPSPSAPTPTPKQQHPPPLPPPAHEEETMTTTPPGRRPSLAARLRAYTRRPTTSARHARHAGAALRALRGFGVLRAHLARRGAPHDAPGRLGEGALLACARGGPPPRWFLHHHAVALGIALGVDDQSPSHLRETSPWRCAAHDHHRHDHRHHRHPVTVWEEGEAGGSEALNKRHGLESVQWASPSDVARALCGARSESCDPRHMVLAIPAADLKIQWSPAEYFEGSQVKFDADLTWTFTTLRHGLGDEPRNKRAQQDNGGKVRCALWNLKVNSC